MNIPVTFHCTNGEEQTGTLEQIEESASFRLRRAGKALGICWLIALVSVILPVIHFILVPGFFLAGPAVFFYLYRQKIRIHSDAVPCLDCGAPFVMDMRNAEWPIQSSCPTCGRHMWIEKV